MLGENMLLGASRGAGQVFVAYQGYVPTGDTEFLYQPELILADRFLRTIWRRGLDTSPGLPDCDADGNVYYAQGSDVVKANNDGVELWRYKGHTTPVSCLTVDADGYVYSGAGEGWAARTDPAGAEVWRTQVAEANGEDSYRIERIAAKSGGICYAMGWLGRSNDAGKVYRFTSAGLVDAETLDWLGGLGRGLVVTVDGAVFAGGTDISKFDLSLNEIWSRNNSEPGSPSPHYAATGADGLVYMSERNVNDRVVVLDDSTTSDPNDFLFTAPDAPFYTQNFEIDFDRSDYYRAFRSTNSRPPLVDRTVLGGNEGGHARASSTFGKSEGGFYVAPVPGRYVNAGMP